jgi:chromosome segregation ATPase
MTEPTIESLSAEVSTLRQTNAELLRKSHERGEKIKVLSGELDTTKASLTTAQASIHEMKDGKLVLLNQAGEDVMGKDGKKVTPEWSSLSKHLATSDDAALKELASISITSKASGGGAGSAGRLTGQQSPSDAPQASAKPTMSFGLRSTSR